MSIHYRVSTYKIRQGEGDDGMTQERVGMDQERLRLNPQLTSLSHWTLGYSVATTSPRPPPTSLTLAAPRPPDPTIWSDRLREIAEDLLRMETSRHQTMGGVANIITVWESVGGGGRKVAASWLPWKLPPSHQLVFSWFLSASHTKFSCMNSTLTMKFFFYHIFVLAERFHFFLMLTEHNVDAIVAVITQEPAGGEPPPQTRAYTDTRSSNARVLSWNKDSTFLTGKLTVYPRPNWHAGTRRRF